MKPNKIACLLLLMLLLVLAACAPDGGATTNTNVSGLPVAGGSQVAGGGQATGGSQSSGGFPASGDSQSSGGFPAAGGFPATEDPAAGGSPSIADDDNGAWRIRVTGPSGEEAWSFTETALKEALIGPAAPPYGLASLFTHVYSTVNNWPTARYYAAEGYGVEAVLYAAGLHDAAQTVTFRGNDGYEVSLTREQLLAPQYYYPQAGKNESGAEAVCPIIAYRWREGTDDLGGIRDDNPCLIIGQRNPFEQTNPAFVENISEIIVSKAPGETWPMASTFPMPGLIATGETVKLQHQNYGQVKLFYTLDGSEPTMLSTMYNTSTYQPELNRPIPITKPTIIKVLVCGYGKADSEIATFEFSPHG